MYAGGSEPDPPGGNEQAPHGQPAGPPGKQHPLASKLCWPSPLLDAHEARDEGVPPMASNSTPPLLLEFDRAGGMSSPRCLDLPAPRVPRGAQHSAWQSGPQPPHPCGTPLFTQGPLTCPQPGPWGRSPWSAFLALSPCWLGRDFLLENSRILPGGPTLGLGTQEEGKSGPAGLVPPGSGASDLLSSSSDGAWGSAAGMAWGLWAPTRTRRRPWVCWACSRCRMRGGLRRQTAKEPTAN